MQKLIKFILSNVGVGNLKIRPRSDNRCESAKTVVKALIAQRFAPSAMDLHWSIAQSSLGAFFNQAVNVRLYPSVGAMRSDRCTRYGRQEIHQVKHEDCVKPLFGI